MAETCVIADRCVGCDVPVPESDVAFRYSSGEICCPRCAPTPDEAEAERIECRSGWGTPCNNADCGLLAKCWPGTVDERKELNDDET